jgi:hypothetical protein
MFFLLRHLHNHEQLQFLLSLMLPRWEEASMRFAEVKPIKPLEAEALEAED